MNQLPPVIQMLIIVLAFYSVLKLVRIVFEHFFNKKGVVITHDKEGNYVKVIYPLNTPAERRLFIENLARKGL